MNGQYYMNGDAFVNFILDFVYVILASFSAIWGFFTSPVGLVIEDVFDLIGFDADVSGLFEKLGLYDLSMLGFMFGSGLAIFLAISLIKWALS